MHACVRAAKEMAFSSCLWGVHSAWEQARWLGALHAGVPKWSIFGDCVNTAARLEQTALACAIQISDETRQLLPMANSLGFEPTGGVVMKVCCPQRNCPPPITGKDSEGVQCTCKASPGGLVLGVQSVKE